MTKQTESMWRSNELTEEKRRAAYISEFVAAASQWGRLADFCRNGGVPGCRMPETDNIAIVAGWFYDADESRGVPGHDPRVVTGMSRDGLGRNTRIVRLSPQQAIECMRDADQSYSPDY